MVDTKMMPNFKEFIYIDYAHNEKIAMFFANETKQFHVFHNLDCQIYNKETLDFKYQYDNIHEPEYLILK